MCILLRHLQPHFALLTGLPDALNFLPRLTPQQIDQFLLHRVARDQSAWQGQLHVVLRQKGLQHFHGVGILHVRWEIRPVPQMTPTSNHGQIHAGAPTFDFNRQDVRILVANTLNPLLVQHFGERADLVSDFSGLLKLEHLGVLVHALLELCHHFFGFPAHEALSVFHIVHVVLHRNRPHTRGRAAFDLIEQARAGAVSKNTVLTGAQFEDLLHEPNGFAHGPHTRIGPKVIVLLVNSASVVNHPRDVLSPGVGVGAGRRQARQV